MDSETLDENELGDRQANGTSMPMDSVTSSFWHEVRKGEPNTPLGSSEREKADRAIDCVA